MNNQIEELRRQFKIKQDDWIEVCKEVDSLKAEVSRLNNELTIKCELEEALFAICKSYQHQVTDLTAKLYVKKETMDREDGE